MCIGLVFLLLTLGTSFAQDNGKKILLVVDDSIPIEMQKMSNDVDIKIDGKIDENVWKEPVVYDPYKVTNPDTLKETIYETKTRFFILLKVYIFPWKWNNQSIRM